MTSTTTTGSRSIEYSLQFALIIHHTIISPSPHIPIPTEFNFFFESYLIFIILFILVAILSPSQSTSFPARDRRIMRSLNFHTNITCRGFSSRILVYNCLSFAEIKNQNINERTIIALEKQHLHLINTYNKNNIYLSHIVWILSHSTLNTRQDSDTHRPKRNHMSWCCIVHKYTHEP